MGLPNDLGTWGFILALIGLILMYPIGVLINLTTPLIANWISRSSKVSLEKRITKLERQLAELEENPAITPVENEILWAIKKAKIAAINACTGVMLVVYFGVRALTNPNSPLFNEFSVLAFLIILINFVQVLGMRYHRDFRWARSPQKREALKKMIEALKRLRDTWPS